MKKIKQNDISQNLYELLKKHNIPMKNVNGAAMCGEMAGDIKSIPLLLGLGKIILLFLLS